MKGHTTATDRPARRVEAMVKGNRTGSDSLVRTIPTAQRGADAVLPNDATRRDATQRDECDLAAPGDARRQL